LKLLLPLSCTLEAVLKSFKESWYDLDIPTEAVIARSVSIYHVDKIKTIVCCSRANDVRVTIKEADQIVAALRAKKILCSLHGEIR
jgi:hypothetical protein